MKTAEVFSAQMNGEKMHLAKLMVVGLIVMIACGADDGLTPRAACENGDVELCARLYACYTAAELQAAGYPASEAACVTMTQTRDGCSAQTTANACTGNETYHGADATVCVSQIKGLACSQVRDPALDIKVAAPACAKVCRVGN
jgi:hypothetical protein